MRPGAAMLIGAATLLSACAEQAGGYAPTNVAGSSYPYYEYSAPAYPGYEPGYYGPGYYGPGVIIGGGGFWGNGYDQDRYWYHRHRAWDRDRAWQEHEFLRHQNEAQTQAQASQQLQQQKAQALAAQAQAWQQLQRQKAAQAQRGSS